MENHREGNGRKVQGWILVLAWLAILALAFHLRTRDLAAAPLHFDEATGARILGDRLEGNYRFDPTHFHGPLLSISAQPAALVRGEQGWKDLSVTTLRLVTAVAGTVLVLSPLFWYHPFGRLPTLAAGALLATSPLLVYYSRIYIHETLLALLTMPGAWLCWRLAARPTIGTGILLGLFLGLMWATKESFLITAFSWAVAAALLIALTRHDARPFRSRWLPLTVPVLAGAAVSVGIATMVYSDFLQRPAAISGAFKTFFAYETTPGHEKPFGYYLELLLAPKERIGRLWSEGLVGVLAGLALVRTIRSGSGRSATGFLAVATAVQFLVYSLIPYKTPWLMVVPWCHLCLLAGYAAARGRGRPIVALLFAATIAWQTVQAHRATGRLVNDSRNPYAYVPTSRDLPRLTDWLQQLQTSTSTGVVPLAVVGRGYWPLPWYLRQLGPVAYHPEPVPGLREYRVVLAMPGTGEAVRELLGADFLELPRTLRSGLAVLLFLNHDTWQEWQEAP